MSGSGKQSFYEIQLSNGSLIAAFVIAMGLGVAVFALGVAVGKGQAPVTPADPDFVESFTSDPAEEERPASSDLDFFERVQDPVEEGEGEEDAAAPPQRAPAATQATPTQQPAPTEPGSTLPPADLTIATGYVVQVKSTTDRQEANGLQAALANAGFPAFVVSFEQRGQTYYRVRVGRYRERRDAELVEAALKQRADVDDPWVTDG